MRTFGADVWQTPKPFVEYVGLENFDHGWM
jgi:hypothetical protein